ncbi:MAG: signal transduction histidine kinase, partial [Bermanella sp.]
VVHMAIDAYRTSEALAHTIESLQCALEDLELFSSAVAHDLKTPARQVALMSDVLLKDLPDNLPAKSRELIVQIGTTGRHQIDMIDQLLDLSQLGKGSLNFSMVMVDELIDNTLEKVRFNLNEELNISLDIDPDIVLHVDREKFQHVIENLVENACKYRSKERALHIEFKAKCTDRTCKIDVSDNGLGINPAALDTIFLPFRRTNTEANIEGTGIGLAVCKRIIALHDGTISASSKEGEGATICIALPAV